MSLLISCLDVLLVTERVVLISQNMLMHLSIFFFISVSFYFMCFEPLLLEADTFFEIFFCRINLFIILRYLSISGNRFCCHHLILSLLFTQYFFLHPLNSTPVCLYILSASLLSSKYLGLAEIFFFLFTHICMLQ